ncbi:MAG: type IV pilus secretin PilQ [Desulfobacterales bacterium]|nr:type IV pilus secretin PilQ [Desulfobacterales bacterium]
MPLIDNKPAWLNRIDFSSEEAGKSAVIIGTTRPVEYQVLKVEDRRLQLKLLETRLPEYRKRALITTRFQSAVDRITPTQPPKTNDTIVAIELREAVPYAVKQTNNIIKINFSPSSIPPKPYEDAKLPAWKKVLAEPGVKPMSELAQTSKTTDVSHEVRKELKPVKSNMSLEERVMSSTPTQKYTGEKIALDFYDTDIKNVFRIIREISGKNFAIDKNVTGKVTLTLDKPVPWDQVLDLVLKMNQLGLTMEGDIIRIATISTLAQEEKLKQEKLKAEKTALNQQKALEPLLTTYIPINYSNAKSEILPHVKQILTANRGKVSVDTRNNQLILTDTAEKIAQARQIVREIDRVTPQVIIEARVVEATNTFVRDLGFDWGTISIGPFYEIGATAIDFTLLANNLPSTPATGEIGFNFFKLTGTPFSIVDAKLQVSEREGKTNIISSPKIVTLDNKKAKIKQGLEVAFLERDDSGGSTVKFKDVDLLLEVTPNITPDDRISMKVFLTKNEVLDPTVSPPTLSTNEADTELLVDDGDTIVIGGIVKSSLSAAERGIPGLRKIGVLGWLFKNQNRTETKNELLIFITPRIVKLAQKKQQI